MVVAEEVVLLEVVFMMEEVAVPMAELLVYRVRLTESSPQASQQEDSLLPCPQSFWSTVSVRADLRFQKFQSTALSVSTWKAWSFAAVVKFAFSKWLFPTIASSCLTYAL